MDWFLRLFSRRVRIEIVVVQTATGVKYRPMNQNAKDFLNGKKAELPEGKIVALLRRPSVWDVSMKHLAPKLPEEIEASMDQKWLAFGEMEVTA